MSIELNNLLDFLNKLRESKIHFALSQIREESIMVHISVPGERWEVEFMNDGTIETEIFHSKGEIGGKESLEKLFRDFSD